MTVSDKITYNNSEYLITWIKSDTLDTYKPVKQIYALVIDSKDNILICRKSADSEWQLPGGKPELNETVEQTIKRELLEEVDVTVSNLIPLGTNEVKNLQTSQIDYQHRYIAKLEKILPQTPDPDKNLIWERKFVPIDQVQEYIKWGNVGNAMFMDTKNILNKL